MSAGPRQQRMPHEFFRLDSKQKFAEVLYEAPVVNAVFEKSAPEEVLNFADPGENLPVRIRQ